MLIDFSRQIGGPHQSKRENFEEFVSQLLSLEVGAQAVDGRGGDGGIDCFHRDDEGRLTVYQAKYFTGRLRSAQRRQWNVPILGRFRKQSGTLSIRSYRPSAPERAWFDRLSSGNVPTEWWGATKLRSLISRHSHLYDQFFNGSGVGVELRDFAEAAREVLIALSTSRRPRFSATPIQAYLDRARDIELFSVETMQYWMIAKICVFS